MATPVLIYVHLFEEVMKIASSYSLCSLLNGFDSALVNILLRNHIAMIRAASDYTAAIDMIEDAVSQHIGFRVSISSFITAENDRHRLYEIFTHWRHALLEEGAGTVTV
jgi:hypothetical protein